MENKDVNHKLTKQEKSEFMINVRPLRTKAEIEDFRWALRKTGTDRNLLLFQVGINTGLRISDIVDLKVKQVRGKTEEYIIEQKTKKKRKVKFNGELREFIADYTRGMDDDAWLFPSRKGNGHISTTQAYRVLQTAAEMLGRDDIGTHTLRKTFGYHHYQKFKDVALLQTILNHSRPDVTLRYIGITDEEIDKTLDDFSL